MVIRGSEGEVRCGYQVAARVGRWEIGPRLNAPDESLFTGTAVEVDDYWVTQEPLALRVRVGPTWWVWPDVVLARDRTSLHLTLRGRPTVER